MANYTNAYATLQPTESKMTNFANEQEQLGFRRREEQRNEQDRKERKQKENESDFAEKAKEFAKYKSKLTPYDSGSRTLNTTIANALSEARDRLFEQYKRANDKSLSETERMQALANITELENYPTKLKNITDRLTSVNETYADGLSKGNIFRNEAYESLWQDGFKGLTVKMDDNFNPDVVFFDLDGDGKPDNVKDVMKFDQINKLIPSDIMMPNIDSETLAYKIGKDLGKTTTESTSGYNTTEKSFVDENTARQGIQSLVNDQNIRSYLRRKGLDYKQEITPRIVKEYEDALTKIALSNTDSMSKQKYNYADENADLSRAQTQKNADRNYGLNREKLDFAKSKSKKDTKTPEITNITKPTKEAWGSKNYPNLNSNSNSLDVSNVKLNTLKGNKKGEIFTYQDVSIEKIAFDKNGLMVVDFSYSDPNVGDKEVKGNRSRNTTTLNNEAALKVASQLGVSLEDLKNKTMNDSRQKIDY